jgi:DNA-binding XRE family transcriptional regulator
MTTHNSAPTAAPHPGPLPANAGRRNWDISRPLLLLAALAALSACGKFKSSPVAVTHVAGTLHTDEVLAAWRNAGLPPEGFAPVPPTPDSAAYCECGKIHGVDTTVCEYQSSEALTRGMQQVRQEWERTDAHTGLLLHVKRTTMVAVDRERREPDGKTIAQMAKVFGKL